MSRREAVQRCWRAGWMLALLGCAVPHASAQAVPAEHGISPATSSILFRRATIRFDADAPGRDAAGVTAPTEPWTATPIRMESPVELAAVRERRSGGRGVWRGAITGAVVGGLAFGLFALQLRENASVGEALRFEETWQTVGVGAGIGALIGAGIGALID